MKRRGSTSVSLSLSLSDEDGRTDRQNFVTRVNLPSARVDKFQISSLIDIAFERSSVLHCANVCLVSTCTTYI